MRGANLVLEKWGQGRFLRSTYCEIEQEYLALFVCEKTQWSGGLSIFYKPEGSRGKGGKKKKDIKLKGRFSKNPGRRR